MPTSFHYLAFRIIIISRYLRVLAAPNVRLWPWRLMIAPVGVGCKPALLGAIRLIAAVQPQAA
ncbi:MAG: hypothetical protein KF868_20420 [Acidobacteria bacterium]|nr:hypothetical protein [Acidobacteriota bacterium]